MFTQHAADDEGQFLPDEKAAYAAAMKGARSLLMEEVAHGELPLNGSIEVKDESGRSVLTVPFRSAVNITG